MNVDVPSWVPGAVFYQIFPDRFRNGDPSIDPPGVVPWGEAPTRENVFGGDLQGVIDGLGYVRELGCDAIYLNPIFAAGANHKYDTFDYYRIDPAFGSDETFDRLIEAAHAAGVRVVLDGVFNHCGLEFAPFRDVVEKGETSRYRDWFDVYDFPVRVGPAPNYATCGGAHYLPRLNVHDREVERFVREVALHWLERGIDGWRLDVPFEVHTGFWRRFRSAVKARFPEAYLVGEEWRDPRAFLRGDTFDGTTHYQLRGLILDYASKAITGEAFLRALQTLRSGMPAGSEAGMLTLLGCHDTPRVSSELGGDAALVKVALASQFTLPGVPLVYYGDEVGLEGGEDPDCRRTMPWNEAAWDASLREHVQRLIELRKRFACLREGEVVPRYGNDRVACYERVGEGERLLVVLNVSEVARRVRVPVGSDPEGAMRDLVCGGRFEVHGGEVDLGILAARRALVLVSEGRGRWEGL